MSEYTLFLLLLAVKCAVDCLHSLCLQPGTPEYERAYREQLRRNMERFK